MLSGDGVPRGHEDKDPCLCSVQQGLGNLSVREPLIAGRDDNMVYFVSISISTCSRIVTPDYILNDCYLSAILCFAMLTAVLQV